MNKNINNGTKAWRSPHELHKTTSSMIMQPPRKYPAPVPPVFPSPDPHNPRAYTIHRHYSEDDFKKYAIYNHYKIVEAPSKAEEEYFPDSALGLAGKSPKQVYSREKTSKHNYQKCLQGQKKPAEGSKPRLNVLKETSSTQSAENISNSKSASPFIKTIFQRNSRHRNTAQQMYSPAKMNLQRENFRIISKLGEGKFGKVFLVKEAQTGFVLAMKVVEKKKIMRDNLLEQFIRELKIQAYLQHPNIISLYGFFHDDTYFYSLMELGCDGQLYSLISNSRALSEETTSFIIKNLLEAVGFMHSLKILHRDIKPENIVLVLGNVKICDFGWAANKMYPGELRNTFCGTPLYLSPEILQGNRYDEKVDLWAVGVLAYELYVGTTPFDINDQNDLLKITTESLRFPPEMDISQEFQDFIHAMLTKNPSQRLTSEKLLEMEFIRKYKDFETCEELCK